MAPDLARRHVGVTVDARLRLKALSLDPARRLDPGADRSASLPNGPAAREIAGRQAGLLAWLA